MSCGEDVNQEEAVSRELRAANCKLWEDVNQPEAVSSELRALSTTCQVHQFANCTSFSAPAHY